MKSQFAKCLWCAGNCLPRVRCLGWYDFDAVNCGGSRWCSVWCGLFMILRNSWSSHFSSSSPNSGRSAGQNSRIARLLRRRNASTRWQSVVVIKPLHAGDAYVCRDTTTAKKTACRPAAVSPWCRRTRSAYSDCALPLMTWRIWSDADRWLVMVTVVCRPLCMCVW